MRSIALTPLLLAAVCSAQEGLRPPGEQKQKGLALTAPAEWKTGATQGAERGRWTIPQGEGQPPLVVSFSRLAVKQPLEEHVARWAKGWRTPEGKPLDLAAVKPTPLEIEGVPAQVVELTGTWVAPPYPGAEEFEPKQGWAGLHALLEGPDGQWSVIATGPAEGLAKVKEAWLAFVKTAKVALVEVKESGEQEEEEKKE